MPLHPPLVSAARRRARAAFLCLPLLGLTAAAQRPATEGAAATATHFVSPAGLDVRTALPEPPAKGSLADRADLNTVIRVQEMVTEADKALAARVAQTDLTLVWPDYGNAAHPQTNALIGEVFSDLAVILGETKSLYQRPRPPLASPAVHPCIVVPHSYSYPSGHATVAFVIAGVVAAILPQEQAELRANAHRFAWARVMGGVHYPTDIEGGQMLGEAFVAKLLANPDFTAQIPAVRAELESAAAAPNSK